MADASNQAQADYWNAVAGETWVTFQAQLDRQIEPLGAEALRVLNPGAGERVIDIGCGCGQTTLALAERVGAPGAVTGVDISRPMLGVARGRPVPAGAATPRFAEADAQTADLGRGVYDAVFSRFGVMFFADPAAAFANIRAALAAGGRMTFVCWRPMAENLWMRLPLEAALPLLPPLPPPDPTAPGPFAFADPDRVRGILTQAGFTDIAIQPFDARIGGGGLDETVAMTFRIGPLGAALREYQDAAPKVAEAVRQAVAAYETADGVLMPAAVWVVSARA